MLRRLSLSAALAIATASLGAAAPAPASPSALQSAAERLVGRQVLRDMTSEKSRKTIRGAKALWMDVVIQKPTEDAGAFSSLEADLRTTDMEGQLRDAGFRVMDPKKKSLAMSLRPTLVLMVLRSPQGAEGLDKGFYVVTANAVQDCTPLGGTVFSTATWIKIGDPIAFSGDDHKDIDAIRLSARACVKAFIDAAQDNVTNSGSTK